MPIGNDIHKHWELSVYKVLKYFMISSKHFVAFKLRSIHIQLTLGRKCLTRNWLRASHLMRAWKKYRVAPHIVCQSLLVPHKNIDLHSLTITRKFQEADFLCASPSTLVWERAFQTTRSQAPGDLGYGTIHSDYLWGLVAIHFACLRYRMPCGFLAHRRKVIYHSKNHFALSSDMQLQQMDS